MIITKTSISHPLRIDTLPFGNGAIGLTFCPGKRQSNALSGVWDRDLAMDLDVMATWGCIEVMTLVEPWDLEELCVPDLGAAIAARGWRWHLWPILDGDPPAHCPSIISPRKRFFVFLQGGTRKITDDRTTAFGQ